MPDLLPSSPTEAQQAAIEHAGGPLLIVAGPGAGKTDVMVRRTAHLILEREVAPENVLVTTFTNKAADELYDRLYPYLTERAHDVHISTIHSFCDTLLRRYPRAHTWGAFFDVLDAQGQFLFAYARLGDLGLSRFPKGRLGDFIADVVATFNLCTEELVEPEAFVATVAERGARLLGLKKASPEAVEEYHAVAEAYGRYRDLLQEENLLDFGMLQQAAYAMLQCDEGVRAEVRDRYRYILVDEYQDTNRLQVLILKEIAAPRFEICAVGDDDQSIYRFRGASVKSFLRFAEDFPEARRIDLDVNFRATPALVDVSSALIGHNAPYRADKTLRAHRRRPGLPPVLVHEEVCANEADAVVRALVAWRREGFLRTYGDVALLLRSVKYHGEQYLGALDRHGVPYTVVADGGFFAREDVLQLKDLFTFCGWKHRWDPRFLEGKLLELKARTLDVIRRWKEDPVGWADDPTLDRLGIRAREDRQLLKELAQLRRRTLDGELDRDLLRLFYEILRATGYFERCCRDGPCGEGDVEAESALLNLAQFSGLIAEFQKRVRSVGTYRLGQYLRSLPERSLDELRPEPGDNAVRVMTVHQAKGLEFPLVVVGSAMEGRFPGRFRPARYPVPPELRLSGETDDQAEHERDQRRLFYVAVTRAEDLLVVGTADKVTSRGSGRSRFIHEIGRERFTALKEVRKKRTEERRRKLKAPVRERISYSALHTYLLCPLQYKLLHACGFAVPQMHWF
ncbi:MAG: ATP-dependent helicase, partial [Planctomycetota bacterium]